MTDVLFLARSVLIAVKLCCLTVGEGKRCSLTPDIADCYPVIAFKRTRAGWWPGATDGQLAGSAFELQWHLQYGQSGAQQAHRSQSPFS